MSSGRAAEALPEREVVVDLALERRQVAAKPEPPLAVKGLGPLLDVLKLERMRDEARLEVALAEAAELIEALRGAALRLDPPADGLPERALEGAAALLKDGRRVRSLRFKRGLGEERLAAAAI